MSKGQTKKTREAAGNRRKLTRVEKKQIAAVIRQAKGDGKAHTAQQTIPYLAMYPDGICKVAQRKYSKSIAFEDINYQLAQADDKTAIFENWCDFLNYFDASVNVQLSFINQGSQQEQAARAIHIPPQNDDFNSIRTEYSDMLKMQLAKGNNGLVKHKYITFSIEADNPAAARARLSRIETDVLNNFKVLGVSAHPLSGYERLKVLHGVFIEAHDDRLPPELIEEARAAAHAAGLPFSEKGYRDGEEPDPYLFDGSMSMEDYELMHRMIEKERSERMAETILSGYLSNLGKYTEGRPAGEWVSFPTTAKHLKEVFDRIGIDGKNYGELHITEYQSSIAGLAGKLTELESLDELNYLGELLKMQFDDDRKKFAAAITYGDHRRFLFFGRW